MPTLGTSFRTREPTVKLNKGATIPSGFVVQLAGHLAPSGIRNRLGQLPILDQVFHCQGLRDDRLIFTHQSRRQLVQEILTASRISAWTRATLRRAFSRFCEMVQAYYKAVLEARDFRPKFSITDFVFELLSKHLDPAKLFEIHHQSSIGNRQGLDLMSVRSLARRLG